MSDYATKKQLDDAMAKQTSEIVDVLHTFMTQVSNEFTKVNKRLDELDEKYDRLLNTIDGFIGRIDKYESELATRDAKIDRLERWIIEISKKTKVPMPN